MAKLNKHTNLTLEQKLHIINYKKNNSRVSDEVIAQRFSSKFNVPVKRRTVNNLINNSDNINHLADFENPSLKRKSKLIYPDLEIKMKSWIDKMEIEGAILNDALLHQKSLEFSEQLGITGFKNSSGWLAKFKKRNGYQLRKLHGEMKTNEDIDIADFLDVLKKKLDEYDEDNIYNLDETGIFYKLIPSKSICRTARPGYKNFKDRVSLMLCTNFSGSDKLKPVIIGKSVKPRCFKNFDQSSKVQYEASKRAWMTAEIFNKWLSNFDEKLKNKRRKVLLIIDNCPAHTVKYELTSIEVLFLPKNSTGILQPMDLGIIRNFKLHFNQYKLSSLLTKIENGANVYTVYKNLTLKDTIIFADLAWSDVKVETIYNCFKHLKKMESAKVEDNTDANDSSYKNFLKKSDIFDPIDQNEFINVEYTENDEITHESSESNPGSNLELVNENEEINEVTDQEQISFGTFKVCLRNIDDYLSQQTEMDEIDLNFKKELLIYNRKKQAKSINAEGILAYFIQK